ncbi:MAG: hypothetical protein ACRDRO_07715 [Pseudonocardiaceae bacterium]
MDWCAWHDDYDQPDSVLGRRLRVVQQQIWQALDDCPPGPLRVVSLCAGQGHDLLGVLARHSRREDVTARLVELDPRNVALANRAELCTEGGTLVWTRHREPPDLVPSICRWLETGGFERQWLSGPDEGFGVGVHRFTGEPQPLDPSARLFTFLGSDVLAQMRKAG